MTVQSTRYGRPGLSELPDSSGRWLYTSRAMPSQPLQASAQILLPSMCSITPATHHWLERGHVSRAVGLQPRNVVLDLTTGPAPDDI